VMVLSAIYECDFCGFSYGFQPGRGPHDALDALSVAIDRRNVSWVVDASRTSSELSAKSGWSASSSIGQKWLKAGLLEDGDVTVDDRGTGQGSVISPLLANVYLHYVLDLWAKRWRRVRPPAT
jgi:RNA-directed DNA polymerase